MLFHEEDEMIESDIHIIEIFGKPYSIAMGKINISNDDETLGYFICYLLYDKKVIRKLGVYEIKASSNEIESINHRNFDFEKEKLILFDEYYEDTALLQPYMYNPDNNIQEKSFIVLKQSDIKFEQDDDNQEQFIRELQERMKKYNPEQNKSVLNNSYNYMKNIIAIANKKISYIKIISEKMRPKKYDYFISTAKR